METCRNLPKMSFFSKKIVFFDQIWTKNRDFEFSKSQNGPKTDFFIDFSKDELFSG